MKDQYLKVVSKRLDEIMNKNIKGIVISNFSQMEIAKKYGKKIIANYTLNISNNYSVDEIKGLGIEKMILSPELSKNDIISIDDEIEKEAIVYGRTLLMTSEYCPIGTYKNCDAKCTKGKYVLKDRMGFEFPIYTDRINCNSKIYNSKITSIDWKDLNLNSIKIDILDETIEEINKIILLHRKGNRLEGINYTNGNINKEI